MTEINKETGKPEQRRKPARVDLHYLISAWGMEPEDEHELISSTMLLLLRYPTLPVSEAGPLLERLKAAGVSIPLTAAQYDELPNPTDIWNVLDNEIRPAITCTLTVPFDPYPVEQVQFVRSRQVRVEGLAERAAKAPTPPAPGGENAGAKPPEAPSGPRPGGFWSIGGRVLGGGQVKLDQAQGALTAIELAGIESRPGGPLKPEEQRARPVKIDADGSFVVGRLRAGKYRLDLTLADGSAHHFDVEVPSEDKDYPLEKGPKDTFNFQI